MPICGITTTKRDGKKGAPAHPGYVSKSSAFGFALKLNVALLCDRGLLDRYHLPFHLRKLGRCLFVATDKESRWPEDDDRGCGGDSIFGALAVLCAGQSGGPGRNRLSFEGQLLASV